MVIGLPPILNFGSPELYNKVVPEVCTPLFEYRCSLAKFNFRPSQERSMSLSLSVRHLLGAMLVVFRQLLSEMETIGSSQEPRSTTLFI